MAKIENLIAEKTFEQFDKLLSVLEASRNKFVDTAKGAAAFNEELSKVKSFKDMDASAKRLEKSLSDLEKAKNKNTKASKDAANAEDKVVAATREKIIVSQKELASINKAGTSLDKYIRIQVRLKAENAQIKRDQRELQKEFDKGSVSADKLSDGLVKLSKRQTDLKGATTQVNAVVKAYSRESEAAEGSSEQLSARLVRLRREWDNLSESQRENSSAGKNLFSTIDGLDEKVKELDGTTGRHQRNVGNYQSAFEGLPGPIREAAGVIQNFSGSVESTSSSLQNSKEGFAALITGLKSAAKAALAFILTPLGATLAGISAALLAAKGWYTYNKNIAEASKQTKQLTGLTGNALKTLRAEIQATADTFDKDYKEVLIATNSVAKQFGISQGEALDVVNKGFIAGADISGEFLDQLKEYPTQLKAIGLTASETTAIITQNVSQGIYSDKGIDAIKEAGLRLREMVPATKEALDGIGLSSAEIQRGLEQGTLSMFEAIQKVSNKLGELPENSAAVGAAIADIFAGPGEDAGLNYLKTLKDIDLNLDKVVASTGKLGEAQTKQLEATQNLSRAWAILFDSTEGTFAELTNAVKLFSTNALIYLVEGLIDSANYMIGLYNSTIQIIGAIQVLKVAFIDLFAYVEFAINGVVEGLKTFGGFFQAVMNRDIGGIKDSIVNAFKGQKKIFTDLGKDSAGNYADAFNKYVNSKKIAKIDKSAFYEDPAIPEPVKLEEITTPESSKSTNKSSGSGKTSNRALVEEIKGVERILDVNKKLNIDISDGAKRVADFKTEQAKIAADAEIAQAERAFEREQELAEARKELFAEIANLAISLVNARFEKQLNKLKQQEDQIDINKAKEIERINKTISSEEDKAARISIIEARAQNEREGLQRRQAEIQRRQAEFEKLLSVGRIIGNTASGITAALASVPPNVPLSIIIGAIGAAQIAKIAATPIPQFYTGVESSPEGFAQVGEKGQELRVEPSGKTSLTPDKATLTYLKKGTKIIPAGETRKLLHNSSADLARHKTSNDADIDKLNETYTKGVKELKKALEQQSTYSTTITKSGIRWMHKKGNSSQSYINRNL